MKPRLTPSLTDVTDLSAAGLLAWLEDTRVQLPLKAVKVRATVVPGGAEVEIDQVYLQAHTAALDVSYTFPLPTGAVVHRCELVLRDRVIVGRAEPAARARELYDAARRAGRRSVLVEQERPNLFTLALGNLPAGEVAVVRLAFFVSLEHWVETSSLRVPLTPGVRYIPGEPLLRSNTGPGAVDDTDQVPDASRLSPPRIHALHPEAARVHVQVRFAAGVAVEESLQSPSHAIVWRGGGAEGVSVGLAEAGSVPDRDFVLRWRAAAPLPAGHARAWVQARGGERFALVTAQAPRASDTLVPHPGRDLYLLLDGSGSMQGAKWQAACRAVREVVGRLGPHDRLWLGVFSNRLQPWAERPQSRAEVEADPAWAALEQRFPGDGTELAPAVEGAARAWSIHSTGRTAALVLVTDGQVGNEVAVVRTALARLPGVPLHAVGIDAAVNDALLSAWARGSGGRAVFVTPREDLVEAVVAVSLSLGDPAWTHVAPPAGWSLIGPARVWPGQHVQWWLHSIDPAAPALGAVMVTPAGASTQALPLQPAPGGEAVRLAVVRQRIEVLEAAGETAAAVQLACAHNLLAAGVSFVAWDEVEQVPVAQERVVQPVLEPQFCAGAADEVAEALPPPKQIFSPFQRAVWRVNRAAWGPEMAHEDDLLFWWQALGDLPLEVLEAVVELWQQIRAMTPGSGEAWRKPPQLVEFLIAWLTGDPTDEAAREEDIRRLGLTACRPALKRCRELVRTAIAARRAASAVPPA